MQLTVNDTAENFSYWQNRPYLDETTKILLSGAEVIIIPEENFRDHPTPLFPRNTMEIYDWLKEHFLTEAAINEGDYQEVALNSKKHRFGKFAVAAIVAPVFASVMASFIYDKLKTEDPKDEIEVEILVQGSEGKSKSIKYHGTAQHFNQVTEAINQLIKELGDEHRTDTTQSTAKGQPK